MGTPSRPVLKEGLDQAMLILEHGLDAGQSVVARHFKGGTYRVLGFVHDATNDKRLIRYRRLFEKAEFVRTPEDFFSQVHHEDEWKSRFAITVV